MVKRFQNILYMFFFSNLLVHFLLFFGRDSSTLFWVENVPFFSEGFCSEILWRCFFHILFG